MIRDKIELSEDNTNDAWCSVKLPGTNIFDPYVEFRFNSTYIIQGVSIAGHPPSDATLGFVTAFIIQNDTDQYSTFISGDTGKSTVSSAI